MEAPECPCCGNPLKKVCETTLDNYYWNPKLGRYENLDGELITRCSVCQKELGKIFPDGVYNYIDEQGRASTEIIP